MRSLVKGGQLYSLQGLRQTFDIRRIAKNQYRKSTESDYLLTPRRQMADEKLSGVDVEAAMGASTRRTQF